MSPNQYNRLIDIVSNFPNLKIGVIGDFFLDKYFVIDPALAEVSLETGKPAHQIIKIYHSPGAAGTVTNNLRALEIGKIFAIGAIGDDGEGYELLQDLHQQHIDTAYLIQSKKMFTPTYTKPLQIEGDRQIEQSRLDIKNRKRLLPQIENQILMNIEKMLPELDGLIIADQVEEPNFGIVTDNVRDALTDAGSRFPQKVLFADSRARIGLFKNMYIKPNKFEAYRAMYGKIKSGDIPIEEAREYGSELAKRGNHAVVVTLEKDGALLCESSRATHIPGIQVRGEIDSVGAGDSFAAGFTAARCAGSSDEEAAIMGVVVSSITIQKLGTTGTATPEEVRRRLSELRGNDGQI
ncbi:carbohydrate kinase [candidate division KSB1 bacterium]|nr:carbohydrate kinase [candidate division KSB1 bacterium]